MKEIRPSTHPGIILKLEFAEPLNLTQARMAEDLGVGIKTLSELYNQKRGISAVMALKLSEYFGTTPQFWMTLQDNFDLYQAYKQEKTSIQKIKKLQVA
ncbi:MAG: HigA family addiction module antitoxin [Sulfuricurvum sp.]|uniref:HigA family addiction module antitoxin n=1 Tax=Sulfuricurvum sp. TaxID=2025608 RepID=UPI00261E92B5|nr:HigA family addiction module antitoxin [Sulfuricurvum sp.]MDD2828967.1 HigA family addiction module antitoxin [Sulfuricurvum sp.]MDD4950066.1 HigA family addiction module antitoxin [Sulfuricurvum sp.]